MGLWVFFSTSFLISLILWRHMADFWNTLSSCNLNKFGLQIVKHCRQSIPDFRLIHCVFFFNGNILSSKASLSLQMYKSVRVVLWTYIKCTFRIRIISKTFSRQAGNQTAGRWFDSLNSVWSFTNIIKTFNLTQKQISFIVTPPPPIRWQHFNRF